MVLGNGIQSIFQQNFEKIAFAVSITPQSIIGLRRFCYQI